MLTGLGSLHCLLANTRKQLPCRTSSQENIHINHVKPSAHCHGTDKGTPCLGISCMLPVRLLISVVVLILTKFRNHLHSVWPWSDQVSLWFDLADLWCNTRIFPVSPNISAGTVLTYHGWGKCPPLQILT